MVKGKLYQNGREIGVVNDVQIVVHAPPGKLKSWDGSFNIPGQTQVGLEEYDLVSDDGRSGRIFVTLKSTTYATFQGTGKLEGYNE